MESTGIMERVRGLLTSGKSSREVIESGYAPGTVYRVQRSMRRTRLAQDVREVAGAGTGDGQEVRQDTPSAWVQIGRLEAENLRLQAEITERTNGAVALQGQLSVCQSSKADVEREMGNVRAALSESQQALRTANVENSELKAYLRSRNCGWESAFLRFKNSCRVAIGRCGGG